MSIATELEKGNYFMHNGEPVRVTRKEVVAVGPHSHTKLEIFYQGISDKGEKPINLGHTDKVEKIDITRKLGQVISISGSKAQLMDMVTYEMLECGIPAEFAGLKENDQVTFIEFNGTVQIVDKRGN